MKKIQFVKANIAPKFSRFINFIIDYFVFYLLMFSVGIFLIIIGSDALDKLDTNPLVTTLLSTLSYVLYIFSIELFSEGKSIGKIITGTMVVTNYGEKPTMNNFIIRSFGRIIPFEIFSFLGNLGWHDKWSNTRVVKEKDFNRDISSIVEIDHIGLN